MSPVPECRQFVSDKFLHFWYLVRSARSTWFGIGAASFASFGINIMEPNMAICKGWLPVISLSCSGKGWRLVVCKYSLDILYSSMFRKNIQFSFVLIIYPSHVCFLFTWNFHVPIFGYLWIKHDKHILMSKDATTFLIQHMINLHLSKAPKMRTMLPYFFLALMYPKLSERGRWKVVLSDGTCMVWYWHITCTVEVIDGWCWFLRFFCGECVSTILLRFC